MAPARHTLLFGPYDTPRCKVGRFHICHIRGRVVVQGITDAPIQWPYTYRNSIDRRPSLVVCGDLVRAIRRESATAVAYHWGVTAQTVTKWRKGLGVGVYTAGTIDLMRRNFDLHFDETSRKKAIASTQRPERNATIAAAR